MIPIDLSRESSAALESEYKAHVRGILSQRFRIAGFTLGAILLIDGLAQVATAPEVYALTFWTRIVLAVVAMGLAASTAIGWTHRLGTTTLLIVVAGLLVDIILAADSTGALASPYAAALIVVLLGTTTIFPLRPGEAAVVIALVTLAYAVIAWMDRGESAARYATSAFVLIAASLVSLAGSWATTRLRRSEFFALAALEAEEERSEALLRNILPAPIVQRLKDGEARIADTHLEASVLFADIVGFTPFSERMPPTDLVSLLDELFSRFDVVADRHGLDKIKTIGDAYMVAGGVPVAQEDHARRIADFALELRSEMDRFRADTGQPLGIRIGINSGPLVAGVIGKSTFSYDLWGDTVNVAARMESAGISNEIQVSAATYDLLEDEYEFANERAIEIKGKGVMTVRILIGRLAT